MQPAFYILLSDGGAEPPECLGWALCVAFTLVALAVLWLSREVR